MRFTNKFVAAASVVVLTACGSANPINQLAASSQKVEQNLSLQCRRIEALAMSAEHPNPATIARHDALERKAADLQAKAAASNLHGAALQPAIEQIAQVHVNADSLYDVASKHQQAASCRQELAEVRRTHAEMWERLAQTADQPISAIASPTFHSTVDQLPPPPVPPAMQAPVYEAAPEPSRTRGETPYAPMIPPVMRDQPIGSDNAMVPPAAR